MNAVPFSAEKPKVCQRIEKPGAASGSAPAPAEGSYRNSLKDIDYAKLLDKKDRA